MEWFKRIKSPRERAVTLMRVLVVMAWRLTGKRVPLLERLGRWLFSIESRLVYLNQLNAIFEDADPGRWKPLR